ncbi:hypothetical protein GCM10022206_34330 [Streptomyces chiangmaiensis]
MNPARTDTAPRSEGQQEVTPLLTVAEEVSAARRGLPSGCDVRAGLPEGCCNPRCTPRSPCPSNGGRNRRHFSYGRHCRVILTVYEMKRLGRFTDRRSGRMGSELHGCVA